MAKLDCKYEWLVLDNSICNREIWNSAGGTKQQRKHVKCSCVTYDLF